MTETGYFLFGFTICTLIAVGIIVIIHRKLLVLLTDLCEGEARALFWTYAIEVWFFLYSISSSLRWCPDGDSGRQLFFTSVKQLKDGIHGMSTALITVSVGLLAFVMIRKFTASELKELRRDET